MIAKNNISVSAQQNPTKNNENKQKIKLPKYFTKINRKQWNEINYKKSNINLHILTEDIKKIASIGDPIDEKEVNEIYIPLCELLEEHFIKHINLYNRQNFLTTSLKNTNKTHTNELHKKPPTFIIAVAGSVAVGKSSVARLLQKLLQQLPQSPKVELVTTDGFLYPNKTLEKNNLMSKKGFPISYDMKTLIKFLNNIKAGKQNLQIPVYSHIEYDIIKNHSQIISTPDILILEGLNVLQASNSKNDNQILSDHFNYSIYLDAHPENIEKWYVERFLKLKETAFKLENSYFKKYCHLNRAQAVKLAKTIWKNINLKNLEENIEKTKIRSNAIIYKGNNHKVKNIYLRNI